MHSAISYELAKARAADLYRQAERDTLARAARRARSAQTRQGPSPVPRHPSAGLARRVLTLLAAHNLRRPAPTRSQPLGTCRRPATDKTSL
jgi:hypothetical protein